jgi:squalene-hopene/tetraprenyl-beta-curcumene cyclase
MTTSLAQDARLEQPLDRAIAAAERALLARQQADGHWVFELEADATIPAEYIMLLHYLDERDPELERKISVYLRRVQNPDGGWPLFYRGDTDVSATVKAYYALKLAGEPIDAPHMRRARESVLALGGAAKCNVFTRIALALFEQVPWRAVPAMPVEIALLPRWFPFHLSKVSYWSRTVVTPLLVLIALRPKARNPKRVDVRELFVRPAAEERGYMRPATPSLLGKAFLLLDAAIRVIDRAMPRSVRKHAIATAMKFTIDRLNGDDGIGAIFPAMANALMALDAMQFAPGDPNRAMAKRAMEKLLVVGPEEAYCQPCMSPIWDTSLTVHALLETGDPAVAEPVRRANDWLAGRQVLDVVGDWAVVAMGLHRDDPERYAEALARAAEWVVGMRSHHGGWGAFDAENEHFYLNNIPFADHGALLDPATEDVTARCVGMLLQLGYRTSDPVVSDGLAYLRRTQQPDGSWFGRWGTNYIYGTWSVLNAFLAAGETSRNSQTVHRAVDYLLRFQQPDGGWGEDGATYWAERRGLCKESTASQTAWAVLALMNAGEVRHPAVARGIAYLMEHQNDEGLWDEPWFTAVGFPRVFYLRYHGYRAFFPLFALARYRNLAERNQPLPPLGF